MSEIIMTAQSLSRHIQGRGILSDVSLDVHRDEILGLIGPNGSGKSSLLRLLTGLQKPDAGHVRFAGRPLKNLSRRDIARRLAFVAQNQEASERITVRQSVALGRTPWLSPLTPWGATDEQAVRNALRAVGLDGFEARDWDSLSGGERQRAHIARGLAQDPELLVLDEPANHLDIHHQLGILDLIASLGVTTIMALHDLNHALRCDRIICLQDGKIRAMGPPDTLLTPELLHEVFHIRAKRLTDPEDGSPIWRFQSCSKD